MVMPPNGPDCVCMTVGTAQVHGHTNVEVTRGRRTKIYRVFPQVFARDVHAELVSTSRSQVGTAQASAELVPDLQETPAEQLVRAILEIELSEGSPQEWIEPYLSAEFDHPMIRAARRLLVRDDDHFQMVAEMANLPIDTWKVDEDGGMSKSGADPDTRNVQVSGCVYTLGVEVTVPPLPRSKPVINATSKGKQAARRPWGTGGADCAGVEGLAAHLAPRSAATFNGAFRVQQQPWLAPLCSMAGTVWAIMQASSSTHGLRRDVLDLCLDALDLGQHRQIAERILVRTHPQHIWISTNGAPDGYVLPVWNGSLGLFAETDDRKLVLASSRAARSWNPKVLTSLLESEPN
jgi:hypothetical protein